MAENQQPISFYGDDDGIECPICFEVISLSWRGIEGGPLACCGQWICRKCFNEILRRSESSRLALKSLMKQSNPDPREVKWQDNEYELHTKCPICRGSGRNISKIYHRFLRMAESGDRAAQFRMGGMYWGTDYAKSTFWYKKSSEKGVLAAMHRYGICLLQGLGCEQSQSDAAHWIKKAADFGFPPSQFLLARCYFDGDGVEQSDEKGIRYLTLSSDQGHEEAHMFLAREYFTGTRVEENSDEAIRLYKLAAEGGNAHAMGYLSVLYKESMDLDESEHWAEKCAEQDDPSALFGLGNFLAETASTEPGQCDMPRAMKYLRRAAFLGKEEAVKAVALNVSRFASKCANCNKDKPANGNLKKCSRCHVMYYCSKDCQVKHWKDGHRKDCVLSKVE